MAGALLAVPLEVERRVRCFPAHGPGGLAAKGFPGHREIMEHAGQMLHLAPLEWNDDHGSFEIAVHGCSMG